MDIVEEISPEQLGKDVIRKENDNIDFFCSIYERMNASNDEIKKQYNNNLLVKFNDVKELHEKTCQTINSLNPNSVGIKIYIAQNGGESEKFNSFEDFENYKVTSPKPTNNIYFRYNFSILNLSTGTFEVYKIKIRIVSRIAMISEFEKEAPPFMSPSIIASVATPVVIIEIEYSDYIKARNFISMVDEWVQGCDESVGLEWLNKMKKHSYLIPKVGRNIIYILLSYFTINAINNDAFTSIHLVKFIIFYFTIFVVLGSLTSGILSKVEEFVDSYISLSYINMNKGDAKLISKYSEKNKRSIKLSIFGLIGTIILGILTNSLYDISKTFIMSV